MNNSPKLIVLTGKTAAGKDTVVAQLQHKFPDLKKIITTTSRNIRTGERNGIDYFFLSEQDFRNKIAAGDFIEYVEYGGNLYGTEKNQITNNLNQDLIWRIDPSRAGQIREFIQKTFEEDLAEDLLKRVLSIYLTVDDATILKRLESRGLNRAEIEKRMQEDARFWQEYQNTYEFVVENVPGRLDETVSKILSIIENRFA